MPNTLKDYLHSLSYLTPTSSTSRFNYCLAVLGLSLLSHSTAINAKEIYSSSCSACHQAAGEGIDNAFPPLAKHIPKLLAAKNGRKYTVLATMHGVAGKISANGKQYEGAMMNQRYLSDAELAAVTNYIANAWGNKLPKGQKPFTAKEFAAVRKNKIKPKQVYKLRPKLK